MGSRPRSGPSGLGDPIRTEEPGRFVPQATLRSDCARLGQAGPEKGFWNLSTCLEHHFSSSVLPCEGPHPDCFGCSGLAGSFLQVNLVSSRWNAPARSGLIHITRFHTAPSSHSTAHSPTRLGRMVWLERTFYSVRIQLSGHKLPHRGVHLRAKSNILRLAFPCTSVCRRILQLSAQKPALACVIELSARAPECSTQPIFGSASAPVLGIMLPSRTNFETHNSISDRDPGLPGSRSSNLASGSPAHSLPHSQAGQHEVFSIMV